MWLSRAGEFDRQPLQGDGRRSCALHHSHRNHRAAKRDLGNVTLVTFMLWRLPMAATEAASVSPGFSLFG
jgi:hypothetical protein